MDEFRWSTPTWLEWVQIAWNVTVGVGLLVVLALTHWGLARAWLIVTVVAAGLPCALFNHILAERAGRELTPD